MKITRFVPVRRQYVFLTIALTLAAAWACTATFAFIRQKPKTVLIGIDQNGTRVIGNRTDPLFESEVVNFIRNFIQLYYSYESDTYMKQVGDATDYFSEGLWKTLQQGIEEKGKRIKQESVSQIAVLRRIDQVEVIKPGSGKGGKRERIAADEDGLPQDMVRGKYLATIEINISSRLKRWTVPAETTLTLKRVARTEANPWGFAIEALEDRYVKQ